MPRNKLRKGRGQGRLQIVCKDGITRNTTTYPVRKDVDGKPYIIPGMEAAAERLGIKL